MSAGTGFTQRRVGVRSVDRPTWAITNLIGNGVATVAISRWEGEVTKETLRERLSGT